MTSDGPGNGACGTPLLHSPFMDFMFIFIREDNDQSERTVATAFLFALAEAQLSRVESTSVALVVVVCMFGLAFQ